MRLRYARQDEGRAAAFTPNVAGIHSWRTQNGTVIAYGFERDGWYWMSWPGVAAFRFAALDSDVTAFAELGAPVHLIEDIYRRGVLPMALQALGHEALHASAVLTSRGVIAFAARSQTGKSTVAFGLSRRGYRQWADDGVVFTLSSGQALAVPLPFDVRLRRESSSMFDLNQTTEHRMPPSNATKSPQLQPTPICALCVLDQSADTGGDPARIQRLIPADAFSRVLVHAHEFNPFNQGRRKRMLQTYLDLVAVIPVYEVIFQPGPDRFPHILDAIVASVGLGQPAESRVPVA